MRQHTRPAIRRNSASINRPRRFNPRNWAARHLQVALASLGRLAHAPLAAMMTIGVIGIALALPTALQLLLTNVQAMGNEWEGAASLSLYLEESVDNHQANALAQLLAQEVAIAETRVISHEQAMDEFRSLSGFADALSTLAGNPLPAVIVVKPTPEQESPILLEALTRRLDSLPEVEFAQLDLQWVQRFQAITEIVGRAVWVLAILLSMAVILTVFNTIRLEIQARQQEIEISKLIGATDSFIRRPFLYGGFWYGVFGGLLCWFLVTLSLWLLKSPVAKLAGLYESDFMLTGISASAFLQLLVISTLLGLSGSWIAVGRHLKRINPE